MIKKKLERFQIHFFDEDEGLFPDLTLGSCETEEEALKEAGWWMKFLDLIKRTSSESIALHINDNEETSEEYDGQDPLYTLQYRFDGTKAEDFVILKRIPVPVAEKESQL